jgi:heme-degrading monooxygenase HmoA
MTALTIDLDTNPNRSFRIDSFAVPEASRGDFEAAMRRNLTFLNTLPGFMGHLVFEKAAGPSTFNIVTIAVWESPEAQDNAGTHVRAYYESIGFDPSRELARWGVKAEIGTYTAPHTLQ